MASLINIGMSGLGAAQSGMYTLGNNIANADVESYSRQQNVQKTKGGQQVGQVFIGTGTTLADVRRVYNAFLENQLRSTTSLSSDAASYLASPPRCRAFSVRCRMPRPNRPRTPRGSCC